MGLYVVSIFFLALPYVSVSLYCSYVFPEYQNPKTCLEYDLTYLSHYGPYNYTPPFGIYTYYLKVCDFISTDMPDVCVSKPPATAYQYSSRTGECYGLGKLENDFAYPLDPTDASAGIRVAYSSGDGGSGDSLPRAVVYDLYCDRSGVQNTPSFTYEWPTHTYRVTWHTSYACPLVETGQNCTLPKFKSTWDSLRYRTNPSWFDQAKFGIFVHWGVYSVPAYLSEWYWKFLMQGDARFVLFHNKVYGCSGVQPLKWPCTGPTFKYQDFAPMFKAELFNPDHFADVFNKSGAKYVVFTTKHHEGWCNFPSSLHWNWNSVDVGPHADLTGQLVASVRAKGLRMGLYHSLKEWFHPLFKQPDLIWADGTNDDNPCVADSKYWKSAEFLSWLYNESPVNQTVLTNTRWGINSIGSYAEGGDRYTPLSLLKYKWETPYTIQRHSWGYDRSEDISSFINTTQLLWQLVTTVSCNGNLLLNVGPMADGTLDPVFEERLLEMGAWLAINGEAIYSSIPWKYQNDSVAQDIWYTASRDWMTVYAISFRAFSPGGEIVLKRPVPSKSSSVTLLGAKNKILKYHVASDGLHIVFPTSLSFNSFAAKGAWTIKLTKVT